MEPLNDVLKETAAKIGLSRINEAGALLFKWKELVGAQVAKNTEPLLIRGETLVIGTTSSVWSHQLAMIKPQIIEKLRAAGTDIKDLSFRATSPPKRKEAEQKKPDITCAPSYSGIPREMSPELRRALASFIGAKNVLDKAAGNK